MTRINLVDPQHLTNSHLMAEYRELPRIFTAMHKHADSGKSPADFDIPDTYKLGKGHVTFFYNKLRWLQSRYTWLHAELSLRKFNIDHSLYDEIVRSAYTLLDTQWGLQSIYYEPKPEEVYINMARLVKRAGVSDE